MKRILKPMLITQIVLGLGWTVLAAIAHGPGGLGAFGVFLVLCAVYAIFFLVAAWAFWKHPGERNTAGWIMFLPVVFFFLPNIIRSLAGGAIAFSQFQGIALVALFAALLACWIAPKKAVRAFPNFLLRSRAFNWLILVAMVGGWLAFLAAMVFVAYSGKSGSSQAGDWAVAYAIVFAALCVVVMGIASLGTSTWAWVSLRSGIETSTRKLNVAQIVLAAPGMLVGALVAGWLSNQGHL